MESGAADPQNIRVVIVGPPARSICSALSFHHPGYSQLARINFPAVNCSGKKSALPFPVLPRDRIPVRVKICFCPPPHALPQKAVFTAPAPQKFPAARFSSHDQVLFRIYDFNLRWSFAQCGRYSPRSTAASDGARSFAASLASSSVFPLEPNSSSSAPGDKN